MKFAASAGDHKLCALFFEKIIPLHNREPVPSEITLELPELKGDRAFAALSTMEEMAIYAPLTRESFVYNNGIIPPGLNITESPADKYIRPRMRSLNVLPKRYMIQEQQLTQRNLLADYIATSLSHEGSTISPVYDEKDRLAFTKSGDRDACAVVIDSYKLIDTSTLEWDNIIEFKQDDDSVSKIRRFRSFVSSLQGKSPAEIIDEIEIKREDYETACTKHGLETVASTFSMLCDWKSALIIAASIYSGDVMAMLGGGFKVGEMAFNFTKTKYERDSFKKTHELAYLFKLEKSLGISA